jgi:hypothetical protein
MESASLDIRRYVGERLEVGDVGGDRLEGRDRLEDGDRLQRGDR